MITRRIICQLYNSNMDRGPVELCFSNYIGLYGFIMGYASLAELPGPASYGCPTHQFILHATSIMRAHSYNAIVSPEAQIAISFTTGHGSKHLGTGPGKHYYYAAEQVWVAAEKGAVRRNRKEGTVVTTRLRVIKSEVLSRQLNVDEIEKAISQAM